MIKGRQMEILLYLLKHKSTTYKQLSERFEVSVKTIERDVDRLSAMGVPVHCYRGVGGGVRIDEKYKFGTGFFTDSDIHRIIFALKIMESLGDEKGETSIIDKLFLVAPELCAIFQSDAENYLSVDLLCEKIQTDDALCRQIDFCLDEEVLAVLDGGELTAPISYVLKADGLYLFCFSKGYKLLKCQDLTSFLPTEQSFQRDFITYEEYKKQLKENPPQA
ncbi:MAG: HTH domain-containing protein [Oscillospiraceae bacterium]